MEVPLELSYTIIRYRLQGYNKKSSTIRQKTDVVGFFILLGKNESDPTIRYTKNRRLLHASPSALRVRAAFPPRGGKGLGVGCLYTYRSQDYPNE